MENKDFCPCHKKECLFYGNCKGCIAKHKKANQIPHCLFPDNNGDRSLENFYRSLKAIYEGED